MFISSLALSAMACQSPAQPAGIPPEWETRKDIEIFVGQVKRIGPLLDELKPGEWAAKGASPAYASQLKSAQDSLGYILNTAQRLAATPDRLTLVLEIYFRLQSLETLVASLTEGTARYQNPALGELLNGVVGENSVNKEKLRQYMFDLAAVKEAEFGLLDKEAQRCRGVNVSPPAAKKGTPK